MENSFFLELITNANDSIIAKDLSGKILFWNKAAEHLFGYKAKEVMGKSNLPKLPESKKTEESRLMENLLWGEKIENFDTERVNKAGQILQVSITISPIKDPEGKIIGISYIIRNISDRKRAQGKFQALLESAPDAMVIVNKFGQMVFVNSQTEKIFGYDREDLIGQEVEKLIPNRFKHLHPGHRKNYFTDPKIRSMGAGLELFGVKKDGSEFSIEISLSPLPIEDGVFVSAAIRDITERKKAEMKFRNLLESAPDAMVIVNQEGKIQLVNAQTEKLFQYHRNELIGKTVEILIPPKFKSRHPKHRQRFFHNPKVRGMGTGLELFAVKKNGEEFPVEISLSPLETEEGRWVSAAIRDITERKAHLAQREQMKKKDMFLGIASHELKTPLTSVSGYIELINEHISRHPDQTLEVYATRLAKNVKKLESLINDLLDVSRIQDGKLQFRMGKHNIAELIRNTAESLQLSTKKHQLIIQQNEAMEAVFDYQRVEQVLTNLLTNAIKYSPEGGIVLISSRKEENDVIISIKDEGIGIPSEKVDKIFERFYRLNEDSYRYQGLGIGLYISKEIIERHNGRIWVQSNGKEGEGATFHFSLPIDGLTQKMQMHLQE